MVSCCFDVLFLFEGKRDRYDYSGGDGRFGERAGMFDGLAGRFVQRGITTGFFQVQFLDIPVFHDDEFTDCRTGYFHSSGFFRVNRMLSDMSDDIAVWTGQDFLYSGSFPCLYTDMAEIFFFEIVQHVNEPLQGDILIGADQNNVFPVSARQVNGEFI